jgi:hypothetical protein
MIISGIWRAFGLQPHRTETFKLSPDPLLIEKVRDIVRLYMNPPDHVLRTQNYAQSFSSCSRIVTNVRDIQ